MPPRRELVLYALLLLMELLPAFAVLVGTSLLDATTWSYALFWPLLMAAAAGLLAGLAVTALRWSARRHRTALLALGTLTAALPALALADSVVAFIVAAVLLVVGYWRGLAVMAEPPDHGEVERRFAYGFAILSFGILWVVARGIIGERTIWQMLALIGIGFLVTSMVALVAARVDRMREPGAGAAVAMAVLVQLGGLVLISLLALQVFALDLAGFVGHATQPFFDALGRELYGWLGYIASPVDRFVSLLRPHRTVGAHLAPPTTGGDEFNGKRPPYHRPLQTPWVDIGALVLTAALLAGLGYLIWRSIPRRRSVHAQTRPYREERRSTVTLGTAWRALLACLRSLFARSARTITVAVGTARTRVWGPAYPGDPVRRAYAQMLRRAASQGASRPATTTPEEFLERLSQRWPDGRPELEVMTAAYVTRRYGELPIDAARQATVGAAWQRLRGVMRSPSMMAQAAEAGKQAVVKAAAEPVHERPSRPFPREGSRPPLHPEAEPWRPTGLLLAVISFAAPLLVLLVFLVILAIASGHLGG